MGSPNSNQRRGTKICFWASDEAIGIIDAYAASIQRQTGIQATRSDALHAMVNQFKPKKLVMPEPEQGYRSVKE